MQSYRALRRVLAPYLLGIVLGLGAALAWAVAVALVYYPSVLLLSARSVPPGESLELTLEGEPLLVTHEPSLVPVAAKYRTPDGEVHVVSESQRSTYRTLEGQLVEIPMSLLSRQGNRIPGPEPQSLLGDPLQIGGFLSGGQRPAYWYVIFRGDSVGYAYFAGYDPYTKLPIGYMGPRGFRVDKPPADEQFTVDPVLRAYQAGMAPDDGTEGTPHGGNAAGNRFLVSGDALYRIDFEAQVVQPIPMPARVVALGATYVPFIPADTKDVAYHERIVVRLPTEIILLNPDGKRWRSAPIPPAVGNRPIVVYGSLKEEIILAALDESWTTRDLHWIDSQGRVTRHATSPLPGRNVQGGGGLLTAGMMPAPWVWAFTLLNQDAGQTILSVDWWLPAALVGTLSALLAVIAYRRQRALADAGAWIWAALVFVLGPPGFVGYLVHRRWPPKTPCEHCGALVPRDRAACRACGVDFPPPGLRGIEIFA